MSFPGPLTPRWRPITKRALDLFGRWGDPRTNLRSMLDSVIPVAVVDRFRDDDEGSIFGIQAFASGVVGQFPSVSFGSSTNDWELVQIFNYATEYTVAVNPRLTAQHMFTPIAPYNPALTPSPAGFFRTGLLTNRAFTFGTVTAIGGYNPVLPPIFGPEWAGPFVTNSSAGFRNFIFDPAEGMLATPIRIYRDTTFTIQWTGSIVGGVNMFVSIIYRERPKVSQG